MKARIAEKIDRALARILGILIAVLGSPGGKCSLPGKFERVSAKK